MSTIKIREDGIVARGLDVVRELVGPVVGDTPSTMTRAASCVVALVLAWSVASAQTIPDFSGTWTADPDRAVLLRRVDITSNGWGNALEGLRRYRPYALKITQSSDALDIEFPSGPNSFMKTDPYALDGMKTTRVRDMGEYWRKLMTEAKWDGTALTLKATRQ